MNWFTDRRRSREDAPSADDGGSDGPRHHPARRDARRRRPAFEPLEPRELLTGQAEHPGLRAALPTDGYPQAVPIFEPRGTAPSDASQQDTIDYRYGPDPDQRLCVLLPADPNGRLDLIVHGGGFLRGGPDNPGILQFAQLDLSRGTTVVSIGYRMLDEVVWPTPVADIAEGIDAGFRVAQDLTKNGITDVTETGLSAGGTALALINYSTRYPTTAVVPDRIVTVSAPLESDALRPRMARHGFPFEEALQWGRNVPKDGIPITLMGNHGDPVAIERGPVSNMRPFARYLREYNVPVSVYYDPRDSNHHGAITRDFERDPSVVAALWRAQDFSG